MPNFAANLSTLFTELPFLDRFAAARKAGFRAVEFQAPYDFTAAEIAARAEAADVKIVLFNAPMGNAKAGDRGFAAQLGREADFDASIATALAYARALNCPQVHVLAGLAVGDERAMQEAVYVANLQRAAEPAAAQGVTLLIEPLNARDNPGYFLNTTRQAIAILDRVAHKNVALQFDFYHCQISEAISPSMRATCTAVIRMSRSPTCPDVMSPVWARSIMLFCSICSTRSATAAGSAANTGRKPEPWRGLVGAGAGRFGG